MNGISVTQGKSNQGIAQQHRTEFAGENQIEVVDIAPTSRELAELADQEAVEMLADSTISGIEALERLEWTIKKLIRKRNPSPYDFVSKLIATMKEANMLRDYTFRDLANNLGKSKQAMEQAGKQVARQGFVSRRREIGRK